METQLIFRYITSFLVILSLPPLVLLINELFNDIKISKKNSVQFALLVIYLTFLVSGVITLYINIQFQFFNAQPAMYTNVALIRNILKQVGIVFASWTLYYITRKGGEK